MWDEIRLGGCREVAVCRETRAGRYTVLRDTEGEIHCTERYGGKLESVERYREELPSLERRSREIQCAERYTAKTYIV